MKKHLLIFLFLPLLVFSNIDILNDNDEYPLGPFLYRFNNILFDNASNTSLEALVIGGTCAGGTSYSYFTLQPLYALFYGYRVFRGNDTIGCSIRDKNTVTFIVIAYQQDPVGHIYFDVSADYESHGRLSIAIKSSNGITLSYERRGQRNTIIFEEV